MTRLEFAASCCWAALALGCPAEPPAPKKVSELEPVIEPKIKPERDGPFSNPNVDPPDARAGAQLDDTALAQTIERGKALAASGKAVVAMQALRACANKIPQSIECEAELALTMLGAKRHQAHAKYYMAQALGADPPTADDTIYRRLGNAAMKAALYPDAQSAFGILLAREAATVDDLASYAHALQTDTSGVDEAAAVYEKAYALDGTRHEFLHKRGILLAQGGDHARAADAFEAYLKAATPDRKVREGLERRIEQLREQAPAKPAP